MQVPRYDNPTVPIGPVAIPQSAPLGSEAFGAGLARGMDALSRSASEMADEMRRTVDQNFRIDVASDVLRTKNDLLLGDDGALKTQGSSARDVETDDGARVPLVDYVLGAYRAKRDEWLEKAATDSQKRIAGHLFDEHLPDLEFQVMRHSAAQETQATDQKMEAFTAQQYGFVADSHAAARNIISFGTIFRTPLSDVVDARTGLSFMGTGRMPEGEDHFFQSTDAPVSHNFVKNAEGRYAFGEITPEIGKAIGGESAPILLRNGSNKAGLAHIEEKHKKDYEALGYNTAIEFVQDIIKHVGAVYQGKGGALDLVVTSGKLKYARVRLEPHEGGSYYDIKTATPGRNDHYANEQPLWENAGPSVSTDGNQSPLIPGAKATAFEANLNQNNHNVKRGYLRFDNNRNFEIGLLRGADLSTFIHESGHFFTEVLGDLAERPDAPRQIRDDYAALLIFAGVDSRARIRTEHHEKLARAFEAYIMDGRAPSVETRSLFQRMKAWMIGVYKDLSTLNVTLNPEIREVFDRMLATDAEIERVRGMRSMKPLFTAAAGVGMSPAEFERYRKHAGQAGELAKEQLLRKLMAEKSRERKPWWRDEQAALRDEVTAEAQAEPVYRALQEIREGRDFAGNATPGLKLDRQILARMYGDGSSKRLPKGSALDRLSTARAGAHPELVAEHYGFSSADEMIRAVMVTPLLGDFVAAKVAARMKERHGDLLQDGRMADEAVKAAHNDQRAEMLRAEISALLGKGKGKGDGAAAATPSVAVFRQTARERIGAKPVRTINPLLYLNGERRSAREAFDLYGRGDFNGAAAAKTRQVLNHFLYTEAATALEEVGAIRAEAGRMTADTGPVARPGREQMETLIARFGLTEMPPGDQRTRQVSLRRFLDRLRRNEGIDLPVPAAILDERNRTANYRDLPMDELRAVSATLHMIGHAAGVIDTVRTGEAGMAFGEAVQQLVERLNASIPDKGPGGVADPILSFLGRVAGHTPEIDIPIIRPEALLEHMDGAAAPGPWHDLLWKPYNEATRHRDRLRESVFPTLFALVTGKGIDRSHGKVFIEKLHNSLTRDEMVAIALNCGNEHNLDLLMRGGIRFPCDSRTHELSPDTLQEILGHLSAGEIEVVNGVWKAIESLKPEMEVLVRRQSGTEPVWIETGPIEVANGILEGGHYPVAFDPRYPGNGKAALDVELPGRMFLRDGMGKVGADPLSIDLESVVVRQLDRIVTLITLGEFASQAKRLLKDKDVKAAIVGRLGEPAYKNLLGWVADTIEQDGPGRDSSRWLEDIRRKVCARASTRIVCLKAADTVADIVSGASRAMLGLDVTHVVRGSFEYLRSPLAVHRLAVESSEHMRLLDNDIKRTTTKVRKEPDGEGTVLDDVQRWIVEGCAGAARVAAMMAWISGYREAQSKGMDGMEAVRHADEACRMIPDIGRAGALSSEERTAKAWELATLIGPALIRYNKVIGSDSPHADRRAKRADGTMPFLFAIVAIGILKEILRNLPPEANNAFLPWFLAHLARGLFTDISPADGVTAHIEGKVTQEVLDPPVSKASKAACEAVQTRLYAIGRKGSPATNTAQYLHDLLTGDYSHNTSWNRATDILINRRHQQ